MNCTYMTNGGMWLTILRRYRRQGMPLSVEMEWAGVASAGPRRSGIRRRTLIGRQRQWLRLMHRASDYMRPILRPVVIVTYADSSRLTMHCRYHQKMVFFLGFFLVFLGNFSGWNSLLQLSTSFSFFRFTIYFFIIWLFIIIWYLIINYLSLLLFIICYLLFI